MVLNFRIACQNPLPERVSANFLHDVQVPKQTLKIINRSQIDRCTFINNAEDEQ